jgi:hypothetical protein
MGLPVDEMVGNQMRRMMMVVVVMMMDVKIIQDEKTGEEEPGAPEWVRDPSIEVVVIPGRGIVGDDGRTFGVVILVNFRRRKVFTFRRRWILSVLLGPGNNSQASLRSHAFECLQRFIFSHW